MASNYLYDDLPGYTEEDPTQVALPLVLAAAAAKKKAAHAATGSGSNLLAQDVAPPALPKPELYSTLMSDYDKRISGYQSELDKLRTEPDYSELRTQAKGRGTQSIDLMRASILAGMGPQDLQPMAKTIAAESASMRSPMKIEGGQIDVEGNVMIDPGFRRQKTREALRDDISAVEKLKAGVLSAQERAERQRESAQALAGYRDASLGLRQQGVELQRIAAGGAAESRAARAGDARDKTRFTQSQTLSREYDGRVKAVSSGLSAAQNLLQLVASPNAAKDPQIQTSMVFAFGKMLDPESVVREGEYKLFEQGRGWLESLAMTPDRIRSGARLTPEQLQRMAQIAQEVQSGSQERKRALQGYYGQKAQRWGLDPHDVMPDFSPGAPGPGAPAPRKTAADYKDQARQDQAR